MIPRLVLITNRSQLQLGRRLSRTVQECAEIGLSAVVVREHDLEPAHRRALVSTLARIDGLIVISSRIADASAHAVHLAGSQEPPARGPWGRSCHSRADVDLAAAQGASWAMLSPFAPSASKPGRRPLAPGAFADHPVPVLALAGVDETNAAAAIASGAHGVAVMGAVMRASSPALVVARLLREVS